MLLTLTTTYQPATDLGYLLHKNPARVQSFNLAFGQAHVFYPEVSTERCTAALLLDIDPIGLVRRSGGPSGDGFALEQYVNDRPYVASSFLSVAIAQVFGSALNGHSKDRQRVLFEFARPRVVILTTPNSEYNVKFTGLPAGKFRHRDHRFEWTRSEFQEWTTAVAQRFGYTERLLPIGPEDATVGPPTQMGVFAREQ